MDTKRITDCLYLLGWLDNLDEIPKTLWKGIGESWTSYDQGISPEDKAIFMMLFRLPNPQLMMNDKERKIYDKLPDTITVYRGHCIFDEDEDEGDYVGDDWQMDEAKILEYFQEHELHTNGLSWTTDIKMARFFAQRARAQTDHLGISILTTATIPKDLIVAYLDRRDEDEIVVRHGVPIQLQDSQILKREPVCNPYLFGK